MLFACAAPPDPSTMKNPALTLSMPDALASGLAASYTGVLSFMAVAEELSFMKAGHRLGLGRSAVSRNVQRLETQMKTRLLQRSTRNVALTPEGEMFYELSRPGVEQIMQAMQQVHELQDGPARGQLRVCSTIGFGRRIVGPLLADFYRLHPGIDVELILDDRITDFTADRIDVSFRNGRLADSSIIARQLAPMEMMVCASPAYATRHGLPETLEDIERHACIQFRLGSGGLYEWEFMEPPAGDERGGRRVRKLMPKGSRIYSDPELVVGALRDGLGIAQVAGYQVAEDLRAGRLVRCLDAYAPQGRAHYLCYPSREHMPMRIRAFVEFYVRRVSGMRAELGLPPA